MRIVLVGGGTGGHFYPLIAIAEELLAYAKAQKLILPELYYMGPSAYDPGSLFAYGITHTKVPAGKIRRYVSPKNISDLFVTFWGILVAIWKLYVIYPDVVMSKGGYTSVPVVIAAWILRIPVVIHESDATPGRANKLGAKFARYIAVSYDDTAEYFNPDKVALTGIPIRRVLREAPVSDPFSMLGIPNDRLLFVIGGSLGAERINNLILESLDELLPQYTILHQVGERNVEPVQKSADALSENKDLLKKYHIRGFLDVESFHAALSAAEVVISRAGSGTIHEIAIHGKPAILIPIPEDVSHDQRTNAYAYARSGAASVIEEKNLTPNVLMAELGRISSDPDNMLRMTEQALLFAPRDAAEKVAQALIGIGLEHER